MAGKYFPVGAAKSWKHCVRKAWFEAFPPPGLDVEPDRFETLVAEFGLAHEQRVLSRIPEFVEAKSAEHTSQLIAEKVPVIYQPELVDHELGLVGRPDFLLLTDEG